MKALGLGKDIRRWIHAIYDNERPPERKIKLNGEKSYQFALGAGVAQGCPLSPLLFLFIGEPLTRMIENDERLRGVSIGEHEHTRSDNSPTTPQRC